MSNRVHRFFVPGKPQGKGRPRFTKAGHAYTPQKTVDYETLIAAEYCRLQKPMTNFEKMANVEIEIQAWFPIPKSDSKKEKARKLSGQILPRTKPDLDNITKAVLDALNGVAYYDDKQVVKVTASKIYGDQPGLLCTVTHITDTRERVP